MRLIDLSNFKFNINFNYVAFFIFVVLLIYMFVEKLYIMRRSKLFMALIITMAIGTVLEIFGIHYANLIISGELGNEFFMISNILQTTYFISVYAALFIFVMYIIHITCGVHYFRKRKFEIVALIIPVTIGTLLFVVNYFYHFVISFVVIDNVKYLEINLYSLIPCIAIELSYIILAVLLIYKFRTSFYKKQIIVMSSIPVLMGVGLIVELLVPNYLILQITISICLIVIQTSFESSEDMIDENTNLYNIPEFMRQLKKIYFNKDNKQVLLFKFTNYNDLTKSYDFSEVTRYNKYAASIFKSYVDKKYNYTPFSLNNGYFAFIFEADNVYDDEKTNKMLQELNRIPACNDYYPTIEKCLMEITKDFETPDEVTNFVSNYRQSISFKNEFTKYSDVSADKNLIISNHLEQIIDTGLREKEFTVYYQPIYSIEKKKFISAEALVRLQSKKYGFISPGLFIPYAEKTGRIDEIDAFVMEEVFKFVSSTVFKMIGLSYVEINLSMAECVNPRLVKRIRELMNKYNVDPSHINMEITESFEPGELDIINENLRKISELGFKLSLDDFGTGYSNINRFVNLPISIVKIDKSLVDESHDESIKKVLDYSFTVVKSLDKETVVEGVETKEQLDRFIDFGADYIQGYYFSRPLDYDKFIEFLYQNNM